MVECETPGWESLCSCAGADAEPGGLIWGREMSEVKMKRRIWRVFPLRKRLSYVFLEESCQAVLVPGLWCLPTPPSLTK